MSDLASLCIIIMSVSSLVKYFTFQTLVILFLQKPLIDESKIKKYFPALKLLSECMNQPYATSTNAPYWVTGRKTPWHPSI